jgi:mannose-1-phosphate guanylyltransferase/mannose-6-phosphate isomerase
MIDIVPVVLCGGSGTRLWPLSRSGFPKQFLCLTGAESLFQQTARRLAALAADDLAVAPASIVCNEEHRFLAWEQWRETGVLRGDLLLEPEGRNTAPALTLAALAALESAGDPVLVVTPSDHAVADQAAFVQAVQCASREAARGAIVILGVIPDRPDTGFGYIKASSSTRPGALQDVERFVEKPDAVTAQRYLDDGGYYWNAGMFVLKASVWLGALSEFRPDILAATRAAWAGRAVDEQASRKFVRPDQEAFNRVPAESVDYAVMERCPGSPFQIRMTPLDAGWSDLGAWDAVWQALPKDAQGNAHAGDVLIHDSSGSLVHASSRLVTLVGVRNLVVIETADAVLVADRSCSQDVKAIVNGLSASGRDEHLLHRKVHRPWGWYDSVDEGRRFKVKRICVNPGASLSLQMHHHRAEHWVVVRGEARVEKEGLVTVLQENESAYIPIGVRHRLSNAGDIQLEIVEVQSGEDLREDDIVRFSDVYGRHVLSGGRKPQ